MLSNIVRVRDDLNKLIDQPIESKRMELSQDEVSKISEFVSLINNGENIDDNNSNILFKIIAPFVDQS